MKWGDSCPHGMGKPANGEILHSVGTSIVTFHVPRLRIVRLRNKWPLTTYLSTTYLYLRAPQSRHAYSYNPLVLSSLLTMGYIPVLI